MKEYNTKIEYFLLDPIGYLHINKHLDLVEYYYEEAKKLDAQLKDAVTKLEIKVLEVERRDDEIAKHLLTIQSRETDIKKAQKEASNYEKQLNLLKRQVEERDEKINKIREVFNK